MCGIEASAGGGTFALLLLLFFLYICFNARARENRVEESLAHIKYLLLFFFFFGVTEKWIGSGSEP